MCDEWILHDDRRDTSDKRPLGCVTSMEIGAFALDLWAIWFSCIGMIPLCMPHLKRRLFMAFPPCLPSLHTLGYQEQVSIQFEHGSK